MGTPSGNTSLRFQFLPASIVSQDMAITPDGARLILATRARYHEKMSKLTIFTNNCVADFDIVEYGVYSVDTRTGRSFYTSRSQLVSPADATGTLSDCIVCNSPIAGPIPLPCKSTKGDRGAGISAIFGGN
jgi:hypothetical protein